MSRRTVRLTAPTLRRIIKEEMRRANRLNEAYAEGPTDRQVREHLLKANAALNAALKEIQAAHRMEPELGLDEDIKSITNASININDTIDGIMDQIGDF